VSAELLHYRDEEDRNGFGQRGLHRVNSGYQRSTALMDTGVTATVGQLQSDMFAASAPLWVEKRPLLPLPPTIIGHAQFNPDDCTTVTVASKGLDSDHIYYSENRPTWTGYYQTSSVGVEDSISGIKPTKYSNFSNVLVPFSPCPIIQPVSTTHASMTVASGPYYSAYNGYCGYPDIPKHVQNYSYPPTDMLNSVVFSPPTPMPPVPPVPLVYGATARGGGRALLPTPSLFVDVPPTDSSYIQHTQQPLNGCASYSMSAPTAFAPHNKFSQFLNVNGLVSRSSRSSAQGSTEPVLGVGFHGDKSNVSRASISLDSFKIKQPVKLEEVMFAKLVEFRQRARELQVGCDYKFNC